MPECTIAIVHSDATARNSLAALLQLGGFKVKLFDSAESFLAEYVEGEANCVIAGIRMPEVDGIALQKELLNHKTPLPMIVITSQGYISLAVSAMKAGAIDFIEDPFDNERLFASVKICLGQGREHRRLASLAKEIAPRLASLTPREREVLEHLLSGDPNKVIAHDLDISQRTIEVHRCRVMAKMHARSLSDLVRIALSAGIGVSNVG